jgi:hypothetical protein
MPRVKSLNIVRKSGNEPFVTGSMPLPYTLLDFWRWGTSDLLDKRTLNKLAEFIVAKTLEILTDQVRNDSGPNAMVTPGGLRVKVRAGSFLRRRKKLGASEVQFPISDLLSWSPWTVDEHPRHADIYIFAVLSYKNRRNLDPLNLDQWRFYVFTARFLKEMNEPFISLETIHSLGREPIVITRLAAAIHKNAFISDFMRLQVEGPHTALEIAIATWPQSSQRELLWSPFRTWTGTPTPAQLSIAQLEALRDPEFFRLCGRCGILKNRGDMHDHSICIKCAGPVSRHFEIAKAIERPTSFALAEKKMENPIKVEL